MRHKFDFLVSNRRAVSREHNDTKIKAMLLGMGINFVNVDVAYSKLQNSCPGVRH